MKPIIPFALLGALLAVGAADAAATDPVGYTTTTIFGAFSPTNPKNNVLAPDLQSPAAWTGTVASVSGDSVTLTGATFTAGEYATAAFAFTAFSHFIETSDGYWSHIVSSGTNSVTVEATTGSNFTVGESVTIRPHLTVASVFGASNETGLLADPGGDAGAADNIVLIDEVNGGTITVFPSNILGGTYITTDFENGASVPIYPDQGLQVIRRGATDLPLVVSGAVDTNGRQITITTGIQIRPQVLPVDTTLNDLDLYTGNVATGVASDGGSADIGAADTVLTLVNGVTSTYFYSLVDFGSGPGWHDENFNFVGTSVIPAGAGLIIVRNNPTNSSPFTWVNPAPTIAPPTP